MNIVEYNTVNVQIFLHLPCCICVLNRPRCLPILPFLDNFMLSNILSDVNMQIQSTKFAKNDNAKHFGRSDFDYQQTK